MMDLLVQSWAIGLQILVEHGVIIGTRKIIKETVTQIQQRQQQPLVLVTYSAKIVHYPQLIALIVKPDLIYKRLVTVHVPTIVRPLRIKVTTVTVIATVAGFVHVRVVIQD
jgi:hypothetical protein